MLVVAIQILWINYLILVLRTLQYWIFLEMIRKHVNDEGYVIISSFSTRGPMMCSGLDTRQHSEESMKKLFSNGFEDITGFEEEHVTPHGIGQIFTWNVFRKN